MKRSLLLPALILISLSPACGQASAPAADAETPAEVSVETGTDTATATATSGPQVGDKIVAVDGEMLNFRKFVEVRPQFHNCNS